MADSAEHKSAHARVVADYFYTTSSVSQSRTVDYAKSTDGLKRGLGDWLDVTDKSVIDLGCGTGELCWLAKHHGARKVIGVNLSKDEIEFARERVQAEFVNQDIVSFLTNCPSESVDRIFALNILEHLGKNELVSLLDEASRCLSDDGSLVAMVPNATSAYGTMTRYWDITHLLAFTPSSVRQLQRLCGFGVVEFREWGPKPHGVVSLIRYALWQMIRGFTWFRLMVETGSSKDGIYTADMLFRLTKTKTGTEAPVSIS